MNKAEEQQFAILSSNYRSEQEERRKAQKKASLLEQENSALKSKIEDMQRQLNEKMDEVADTVRQMAQFMMGKGPVTLSDSLRDAIVAGVKEEFETKLREEREAHEKAMQSLKDQFALLLAAKDNEIAVLKAKTSDRQGDDHGTVSPGQPIPDGMTPEDRIKQLEQQKNDVTVQELEKCSEITDIIIRVACLVHIRRPFFKLKDCSQDFVDIVHFADEVFHRDKLIKATYKGDFDKIAQERVLQIGPILQSIKDKLDMLEKELDPEKEPELVKAVKYALKEYPCLLHCLKNGALDFSNNSVEREIRRLAKYRNNSFFVGSPKGGVRLARTLTIFANCKAYNIDPYKYLCDVFRRIKNTARNQMINLVAHRWQPQLAPAIY